MLFYSSASFKARICFVGASKVNVCIYFMLQSGNRVIVIQALCCVLVTYWILHLGSLSPPPPFFCLSFLCPEEPSKTSPRSNSAGSALFVFLVFYLHLQTGPYISCPVIRAYFIKTFLVNFIQHFKVLSDTCSVRVYSLS